MKKSFIILMILIILLLHAFAFANDNTFNWHVGEELVYKVKWSFFRLGTLTVQVYDSLKMNNALVYHLRLNIDSNPLLFWVNMHNVYDCYIDSTLNMFLLQADEKIDGVNYKAEYRFNYEDSLIYINMTSYQDPSKTIIREEPMNRDKILDGTALIYYARIYANSVKEDTVFAFFESNRGKVSINFKGLKDKIEVGAFDNSVPTYYVDGNVGMQGIAGLKGPFKGWFAVDPQRPPLKAELKVFIGHVKLELESWKNWEPSFVNKE